MSDKIARLGIDRDPDMMYYVKDGDVWATPRKQKGQPKGRAQKVASTGLALDYSRYLYYVDGDGDVARKERALGGGRKAKPSKAAAPSKPVQPKIATRVPTRKPHETVRIGEDKKSEAQLDREIEECLAQAEKKYGLIGAEGDGGGQVAPASERDGKMRRH